MRTFLRATISLRFFRLRALNTSLQNNSYHEHKVELSKMADWTVYKPERSLANFNHPFVFVDIMAERVVQEVFTHYNYAITSVLKCVLAKKRQSRTKPRCPPYAGKMKVTGSQFPGWRSEKHAFPEINALTFKMASYDVTICISWETRGNFRTRSPFWNTFAFYPCFLLLGLGDRITKWHSFGMKVASLGEAVLLQCRPQQSVIVENIFRFFFHICWKYIP